MRSHAKTRRSDGHRDLRVEVRGIEAKNENSMEETQRGHPPREDEAKWGSDANRQEARELLDR